jgi:ABC-type nitrate/sulfonate/bicarbonate transport system permease component
MQRSVPHARGKGLVNGIPAVLSVASAFALWEIYVRLSGISPLILPAPSRVVDQIVQNRALLWGHIVPTMKATLAGFACSVTVAFVLSVILDFMPRVRRALFPIFAISQTLPLVAIAPLVVLWFGFFCCGKSCWWRRSRSFPCLSHWLTDTSPPTPKSRRCCDPWAPRARVFRLARLPSAMPYFFAGLRISITYAVVAAIFAEYVGARAGLGIVILNAKNSFRPDLMLAAVVISSILTLALFGITAILQRIVLRWRDAEGGE